MSQFIAWLAALFDKRWTQETTTKVLEWLGQQGVSTVLLFAILFAINYQAPYVADRVERIVDKAQAGFTERSREVITAFREDQARDERARERDSELIEQLIQDKSRVSITQPAEPNAMPRPCEELPPETPLVTP